MNQVILVSFDLPDSVIIVTDIAPETGSSLVPFQSRLAGKITYSREINCLTFGSGKTTSGLGVIEIVNTDGVFDYLCLNETYKGATILIMSGVQGMSYGDYTLEARSVIDRIEGAGEKTIRVYSANLLSKIEKKPIQENLYLTGSAISSVDFKPRPLAIGHPLSCPIVLVDDMDYVYDVHENADYSAVILVRDSGYELSTPAGFIISPEPLRYGIEKLFLPVGKVVADVEGATVSGTAIHKIADIVEYIVCYKGGLSPTQLDAASLTALETIAPYSISLWIENSRNCQDVLQQVMDSFNGWIFENKSGYLEVGRLENPSTQTSVYTLDETHIVSRTQISIDADKAKGLSLIVGGARNWHVYDESELADGIPDADKPKLCTEYRHRAVSTTSISAELANLIFQSSGEKRPNDIGIGTLIDDFIHCQDFADHLGSLYPAGKVPRFIKLDVYLPKAAREVIDCGKYITLKHPRFNLATGQKCLVKKIEGSYGDARHTLTLWTLMEP